MTDNTETEQQEGKNEQETGSDPVRKWTIRILVLCVVLFAGYLTADRLTPVTSQARIHSLVVPVAAEVAGIVSEVAVENNQQVQAGGNGGFCRDRRSSASRRRLGGGCTHARAAGHQPSASHQATGSGCHIRSSAGNVRSLVDRLATATGSREGQSRTGKTESW